MKEKIKNKYLSLFFLKLTYRIPIFEPLLPPVFVVVGGVSVEGGGGGLVPVDRLVVGREPFVRHGRSNSLRVLEKKKS